MSEQQEPRRPSPATLRPHERLPNPVLLAWTSLRTFLLAVGYTVPMLILFTPGNIPVRFLEPIGLHDGNRWVADLMLLIACPALVWLAQMHDGPAIRSHVSATFGHVSATIGRSLSGTREPFVAFTVEELSAVTSDYVGRGGFGVVYAAAGRTTRAAPPPS